MGRSPWTHSPPSSNRLLVALAAAAVTLGLIGAANVAVIRHRPAPLVEAHSVVARVVEPPSIAVAPPEFPQALPAASLSTAPVMPPQLDIPVNDALVPVDPDSSAVEELRADDAAPVEPTEDHHEVPAP